MANLKSIQFSTLSHFAFIAFLATASTILSPFNALAAEKSKKLPKFVEICGYKIPEAKVDVFAEPSSTRLALQNARDKGGVGFLVCSSGKDADPSFSDMIGVITFNKANEAIAADKYFYLRFED